MPPKTTTLTIAPDDKRIDDLCAKLLRERLERAAEQKRAENVVTELRRKLAEAEAKLKGKS